MAKYPGLIYAVSTVVDGNMALKWGDKNEVWRNREKFLDKNSISVKDCVFTSLVHGVEIKIVGSHDKEKILEADGFITLDKQVAIWITTGDCLPVVVYDSVRCALALVHLSWQGVDKGLTIKAIQKMVEMGSNPANLGVKIGPGARKESYIFDGPIAQENDPKWQPFLEKLGNGRTAIDLVGFIKKQLVDCGVEKIEDCGIDTAKGKNYFSHYRAVRTGESEGRFATVVMMV